LFYVISSILLLKLKLKHNKTRRACDGQLHPQALPLGGQERPSAARASILLGHPSGAAAGTLQANRHAGCLLLAVLLLLLLLGVIGWCCYLLLPLCAVVIVFVVVGCHMVLPVASLCTPN
jgi:hypothetical protein